jgi:2-dehydro-3-deoxygalactonokinase
MIIVSVDGGTTNTRLTLVENGNILSTVKIKIGAGNRSASCSENPYWIPLRDGLQTLLQQNGLASADVEAMIFSGMICSETGLHTVPHLLTPATADTVALAMEQIAVPQIADIPMFFVPGLRIDSASLSDIDIMRGEETELFGICRPLDLQNFVAVMPGSRTKIVRVEENGAKQVFEIPDALAENAAAQISRPR